MARDPRSLLPKRFRPFFDQSMVETALRYGSQQDALKSIFDEATTNYQRQSDAQETMGMSLLGSLGQASTNLTKAYTDAGLTPALLAQIGGSPTGQRIASELAAGQADIQEQQRGALAGQQYIQSDLADKYREDVGAINRQLQSLLTERGLFQQNRLESLIGDDRAARSAVNAAARKQVHDDAQATADRTATMNNALIGQGLLPGEDGSLTPLPGGKADPNAPGNKPKRTTGAGTASPDAQRTAGSSFKDAVAVANGLTKGKPATPETRQAVTNILTTGRPASGGSPVFDTVEDPTTKKKSQKRRLNPDGSQVTTTKRPAIPKFDSVIASAATEQAMFGYVTTATVRELQKLGYSVRQFPGLVTEQQRKKSRPKPKTPASVTRPGTAPSRDQQPG